MRPGFQIYVDARGDLHAAEGTVIDRASGAVFTVAGTAGANTGLAGGLAPHLADLVEIPTGQGLLLLGGSGRNIIVTGHPDFKGVWRPGRPGTWKHNRFTLTVAGASDATISNAVDVVAILSTGGAAPAGSYVANAYGQDTYNLSAAFTLTAVTETGWPAAPVNIDVEISDGTARDGLFTTTDGVNFVSALDADWTIAVAEDGSAEYRYDGVAMASRASGLNDDACGIYTSTELGKRLNPTTPEDDPEPLDFGEDPVNPFGILTLTFNWSGAPDLDIGVSFLEVTAGYGHSSPSTGGPVGPYMTWAGDNTSAGGPETVVIDLAAAWASGDISTFADVLAEADWFPSAGGSGPASLTVTYDLPGAPGTPVNHILHPGQLAPATTDALSLRILADGSVSPTGTDWTATVRATRRVPVAGVVSIAITETAGTVTAAADPVFSATLPAAAGDISHYALATSDGSGHLKQLHTGPLTFDGSGEGGLAWVALTQAAYNALSPPDAATIYDITNAPWSP